MDEFDVAVVVFVRAQGVDERDAENRAEGAVRQVLRNEELMARSPVPGQRTVVVATAPLGAVMGNGYLTARPSAKAFKQAGLDAPRQAVTD